MTRALLSLLIVLALASGLNGQNTNPPVYVTLWFDTEDYLLPQDDDATKRLAEMLTRLGVRATFKIVGEKARVLESRGRRDVIAALKRHDIGYHSNTHSQQPTIAVYLQNAGWEDGRAEFYRREVQGVRDIEADLRRDAGHVRAAGQRVGAADLPCAARFGDRHVPRRSRPRRHRRSALLLRGHAECVQDAVEPRADGPERRREPCQREGRLHEDRRAAAQQGRRHDQHLLPSQRVGPDRVLGRA